MSEDVERLGLTPTTRPKSSDPRHVEKDRANQRRDDDEYEAGHEEETGQQERRGQREAEGFDHTFESDAYAAPGPDGSTGVGDESDAPLDEEFDDYVPPREEVSRRRPSRPAPVGSYVPPTEPRPSAVDSASVNGPTPVVDPGEQEGPAYTPPIAATVLGLDGDYMGDEFRTQPGGPATDLEGDYKGGDFAADPDFLSRDAYEGDSQADDPRTRPGGPWAALEDDYEGNEFASGTDSQQRDAFDGDYQGDEFRTGPARQTPWVLSETSDLDKVEQTAVEPWYSRGLTQALDAPLPFAPTSSLREVAEAGGQAFALPHEAAWWVHDKVAGQELDQDAVARSYEWFRNNRILRDVHLGDVVDAMLWRETQTGEALRGAFPGLTVPLISLVPGQEWARVYSDDRQMTGADFVAVAELAAEFVPVSKVLKVPVTATRAVLPGAMGGGFVKATTPATHVAKLLASTGDQAALDASIQLRNQLATQGFAEVELGGRVYRVHETALDLALRQANVDATLTTTASPDVSVFAEGGVMPELKFPDGRVKPLSEQFQFRTPGGSGVLKFAERSAFGNVGDNPGLVVYSDDLSKLAVPGSTAEPLGVKHYAGGRELELGLAEGGTTQQVRKAATFVDHPADLYLAEDLDAPSYGQRVSANVRGVVDTLRARTGQIEGAVATPEDIARARFGKSLDELTPEEGQYARLASQDDDALRAAESQGSEAAAEILAARRSVNDSLAAADTRVAWTTHDVARSVALDRARWPRWTNTESGLWVREDPGGQTNVRQTRDPRPEIATGFVSTARVDMEPATPPWARDGHPEPVEADDGVRSARQMESESIRTTPLAGDDSRIDGQPRAETPDSTRTTPPPGEDRVIDGQPRAETPDPTRTTPPPGEDRVIDGQPRAETPDPTRTTPPPGEDRVIDDPPRVETPDPTRTTPPPGKDPSGEQATRETFPPPRTRFLPPPVAPDRTSPPGVEVRSPLQPPRVPTRTPPQIQLPPPSRQGSPVDPDTRRRRDGDIPVRPTTPKEVREAEAWPEVVVHRNLVERTIDLETGVEEITVKRFGNLDVFNTSSRPLRNRRIVSGNRIIRTDDVGRVNEQRQPRRRKRHSHPWLTQREQLDLARRKARARRRH